MEDVWLKGVIKCRESSLAPQRVLLSCSIEVPPLASSSFSCIAICKYGTLKTQPLLDGPYVEPDYDSVCYPNVVQVSCSVDRRSSVRKRDGSGSEGDLCFSLYVSPSFLDTFSFFEDERVWFRSSNPASLNKVYLSYAPSDSISEDLVKKSVTQLYSLSKHELVIFNQSFKFTYQPSPEEEFLINEHQDESGSSTNELLPTTVSGSEIPLTDSRNEMGGDYVDTATTPYMVFDVLATTPIQQGYMSDKTEIVLIFDESETNFSRMGTLEAKGFSPGGNESEDDDEDEIFIEPMASPQRYGSNTPVKHRSASFSSASDFRYDDSSFQEPLGEETQPQSIPQTLGTSRFEIEVRPVDGFKLQYHFILLPKSHALQFNIYELHNVLVKALCSHPVQRHAPPTYRDLVVHLRNGLRGEEEEEEEEDEEEHVPCEEKKHITIVRLYENERDLEPFFPHTRLGHKLSGRDLKIAYVHPELFFYFFPQTLPVNPRQYMIEIEDIMTTPSSTFSQSKMHPLSASGGKRAVSGIFVGLVSKHDVPFPIEGKLNIQQYLRKNIEKLKVNTGDVFSLNTSNGRLLLRVLRIEPEEIEEGGLIREDNLYYEGLSHSYLPYLTPPTLLTRPTSYWEEIHPPGLEKYCKKLFGHFITKLHQATRGGGLRGGTGNGQQSRCALTLVSGPLGVGKRTVIRSVARQCRLHVIEVNCYAITSDAIGSAEKKLKIVIEKAIENAPCVLILRELQVLTLFGQIEGTHEDEPRVVIAFEKYISTPEANNSRFPVILVGVASDSRLVSPRIQQCFLHEMVMTPPTLTERHGMIESFAQYDPLSFEVDTLDVAQRTAGFVLGDFQSLFSSARQFALQDQLNDLQVFEGLKGWYILQDISISGLLITSKHLNDSLDKLHSLHSMSIGAVKIPSVKWKDVGGLETAKKEILETIQLPLLHPELFASGLRRSGILLYGAPGTGKTLLAKAVATECSLNFISIKGPELINMYVGQTEENIREVFARARGAAPCIIFFDELDSIAPNRGKTGDSGGVMDRVVSQLLAELDGMDKVENVFVIGATNRPDLIDPALLRPGRFDRLVYLDVCEDTESKLVILKAITRKFKLSQNVDLEEVAKLCPTNLTGADLYSLCADAMMDSLRKQIHILEEKGKGDGEWAESLEVCREDFMSALSSLVPSVSKEELEMYRNKKSFSNVT